MKRFFLLSITTMLFNHIIAQDNIQKDEPKGKWRVSKEYDDQGNMISYDSIYVESSGNLPNFEYFQNDSLPHHFKGFIRDFEMPNLHFPKADSLGVGMHDFFEDFEFPDMNFQWFENDSIKSNEQFHEFFNKDEFNFQKQIDDLKKQIDEMKKSIEEKHKSEAIEPKKTKEKQI